MTELHFDDTPVLLATRSSKMFLGCFWPSIIAQSHHSDDNDVPQTFLRYVTSATPVSEYRRRKWY